MEEARAVIMDCLDEHLVHMILSGKRKTGGIAKVKIRPIKQGDTLLFQAAIQSGSQQLHKNLNQSEMGEQLLLWLAEDFKQLQILKTTEMFTLLAGKKGNITIKRKKCNEVGNPISLEHNRQKQYILEAKTAIPFLVDVGVMTKEGRVIHAKYDKFRQINRFLEFIEDIVPHLEQKQEITILDFGCGKSYLTFAMYHYLKVIRDLDVRIIGLDLKEDVIKKCSELAKCYGYDKLTFLVGDIASYKGLSKVDMVVTLHACDTATDYALAKAVEWGADVILSVPCCQHELNTQIHSEALAPLLRYGLIKERVAALFTDALRAELLAEQGYQTQILEFIDSSHTPKNILIRAVKNGEKKQNKKLEKCMDTLGVNPLLVHLFKGE